MTSQTLGRVQVLVSSASFALSSIVVHWSYDHGFNPYNLQFGMSLLATLLLLLIPRARQFVPHIRRRSVWLYSLAGGGSGLLFGIALVYLQPGLATLLFYTYPVAATLGAWLMFGHRPRGRDWLALALTCGGAALTVGPLSGEASWIGVVLVLASMLGFALYVVLGQQVVTGWNAAAATATMRAVQTVLTLLIAPVASTRLPDSPPTVWLPLLLLVTVTALAGFLLLAEGIGRIQATLAAILTAAELPFVMVFSWLLLAERFTLAQTVGAALIVSGLVWAQVRSPSLAN